jgi:F420-non-reducing hydrogenase iron-sulfur subunit
MKKMLEQLGLEPGRVRLEWVSAAEGDKFARVVTEFTEEIRALGPLGWKTQTADDVESASAHVEEAVPA